MSIVLAEGQTHTPLIQEVSMPQSLTKLYAHLIFSTRNRKPFLDDNIRETVHGYMATILRASGSPYVVVGGVADHVHILFDMGKTNAPARFVEHVKRESSKFVKTLGSELVPGALPQATVRMAFSQSCAFRTSAVDKDSTALQQLFTSPGVAVFLCENCRPPCCPGPGRCSTRQLRRRPWPSARRSSPGPDKNSLR
jgi:REP element-mobilizing transposase RayT